MAWNVLVHNGVLQLNDPGSAVTFLRSQTPGVYTTTRSANGASCLLLWDRHLARLAQSVKIISTKMPELFPKDTVRLPDFQDFLKFILGPSLKVGLRKAMQVRRVDEELMLTTFVSGSASTEKPQNFERGRELAYKEHNGFEIYVHISRCMPDPLESVANSAHLAVMGPGRSVPNAKHSDWVRARQVLERSRPTDVTEIILSNDGDSLLEGMVSNFFVVVPCMTGSAAKGNENSSEVDVKKNWEGIVVQTAPLEGVLPGVIRQLTSEICAEQGVPFKEVAPSWKNRNLWKEAFITNSVRLVQSVKSVQGPIDWDSMMGSEDWQKKPWERLILQAPGHFTQSIQDLICSRSLLCSVSMDSFLSGP